ncbi:MAG: glycogen debranching enzyme family protein [Candidatus Handelsmanbacteria bacterium]|nr:glycogen debranching enzyme family protein [Candidatus Handelsmanbacteria bacterium]
MAAERIEFDARITADLSQAVSREWLETNGLGGWASSTLAGAHTRRYHGLLVVATRPPVGRMVMLSKLDETLVLPEGSMELGCNLYPGAVHPQGYHHLKGFALDPFPIFTYETQAWTLRKTIAMVHGEHTLLLRYELLRAPGPAQLELRPFFAGRDYHQLTRANPHIRTQAQFEEEVLHFQAYEGQPEIYLWVPGGHYAPVPDWYYNHLYPREAERGLDYSEDLFTCGILRCPLEVGKPLTLIASTVDPRGRDGEGLMRAEVQRRAGLTTSADPLIRRLSTAADQFLVRRGDNRHTLVAGYHWFTDWGRDSMISLPGICLVTGRHAEARSILLAFSEHLSQGMIPNRFPDAGEEPEYNTVDATLWFFVAVYKYLHYTGDRDLVASLWPALEEIVAWHQRGTRFQIRVEEDGLLSAGEPGVQLTWMDAKVGDWVVTPRQGKAVEINALWYNALRIMEELAGLFSPPQAYLYAALAGRAGARFGEIFWNEEQGCLYDLVDSETCDPSLRPNQLFALSLPFPLLEGEKAESVLAVVERHLLTPYGLRSLAPGEPGYRPRCEGPPWERDGAYHQGTAWSWLLGPYITALVRLRGEEVRAQARALIEGLGAHLGEAGVGTLSEIFDAEPPFVPRGCIAQTWSVAELLRAYCEDILQLAPPRRQG